MKYKRVLIKISGESIANHSKAYDEAKIINIVNQFKSIKKKYPQLEIAVVIGGGNIWRGRESLDIIDRYASDYIGILATAMNGFMLENVLNKNHISAKLYNSFDLTKVGSDYLVADALKSLKNKDIVILSGGTGWPYFTTDTAAALRACELECEVILMAKNGVDGVYDSDPKLNPKATRFSNLSYDECIAKDLAIMDQTAFTLCKENNIQLLVFNSSAEKCFENILLEKIKYTLIK